MLGVKTVRRTFGALHLPRGSSSIIWYRQKNESTAQLPHRWTSNWNSRRVCLSRRRSKEMAFSAKYSRLRILSSLAGHATVLSQRICTQLKWKSKILAAQDRAYFQVIAGLLGLEHRKWLSLKWFLKSGKQVFPGLWSVCGMVSSTGRSSLEKRSRPEV